MVRGDVAQSPEEGLRACGVVAHTPVRHARLNQQADVLAVCRARTDLCLVELREVVPALALRENRHDETSRRGVARIEFEDVPIEALGGGDVIATRGVGAGRTKEKINPGTDRLDGLGGALEVRREIVPPGAPSTKNALEKQSRAEVARIDGERGLEDRVGLLLAALGLVLEHHRGGAHEVRRDHRRVCRALFCVLLKGPGDVLPAGLLGVEPLAHLRRLGVVAVGQHRVERRERRLVIEKLLLEVTGALSQQSPARRRIGRHRGLDGQHRRDRLGLAAIVQPMSCLREKRAALVARLSELIARR